MAVTASKRRFRCASAAQRIRAPLAGVFSVLILALLANPAGAVEWRFSPSVGGQAIVTDNANQSHNDPHDALILSIHPAIAVRSEGSRRVQLTASYGLSGVARFGQEQNTDVNHYLGAVGKAELIDDFLYIDGTANISQELISLLGSPADATTNSANRTAVGIYSISPYIRKHLGTFADATARYTASGSIFQNNVASNSSSNSFTAGLNSGTGFHDFTWALDYWIRKTNYTDNTVDTTFEGATATAGYALTRNFRVFGTVGQEWNEYLSATGTSGSSYSVGFGWSPTRRTTMEASVGERYFGNTYTFSGSHRTRSTHWTASYSENVNDITQQLLTQTSRIFWVCNSGLPVRETLDFTNPDPTSCAGPVSSGELASILSMFGYSINDLLAMNLLNISIANGVYIIKSFNAGVTWDLRRLTFGLSAQDTRRLYQALENAQDQIQAVTGSVNYRMSPEVTATTSLSLTRNNVDAVLAPGGLARQDDILSFSMGLNRRFTDKLMGALTLRHTQRNSNLANANYDENSITASVNMNF